MPNGSFEFLELVTDEHAALILLQIKMYKEQLNSAIMLCTIQRAS
jgi:hypothetical protein